MWFIRRRPGNTAADVHSAVAGLLKQQWWAGGRIASPRVGKEAAWRSWLMVGWRPARERFCENERCEDHRHPGKMGSGHPEERGSVRPQCSGGYFGACGLCPDRCRDAVVSRELQVCFG